MRIVLAGLLLTVLFGTGEARAQSCADMTPNCVELSATADTSLFEGVLLGDRANSRLYTGECGGGDPDPRPNAAGCPLARRSLIRFDVGSAGIPAGATVDSVELTLCVLQVAVGDELNSHQITLRRVLQDWGESTMVGQFPSPAFAGQATWNAAAHLTTAWTVDGTPTGTPTTGGSFVGTISASKTDVFALSTCHTFGSTGVMQADVQGWIDASFGDNGWILRGDEAAPGSIRNFSYREAATDQPVLRIEFTPEDPCGNGTLDAGETCDDSGTTSGDGCSATCQSEPGFLCSGVPSVCISVCGDGAVASDEQCDDSGTAAGDGCSATCETETGYICSGSPSSCSSTCGDGVIASDEQCDDSGTSPGDGCSATCQTEAGFQCNGVPSVCSSVCGDGLITAGETCDDSGTSAGDGCDSVCQQEAGFSCSGAPSVCSSSCGDGVIASNEQCDDNGALAGDGCSASCVVENGFACSGVPSVCASTCGDGVVAADEQCDDGGLSAGDGCDVSCVVEAGFVCGGQPSNCIAAGVRSFAMRWSGASLGNTAEAGGLIRIDEGLLANPGSTSQTSIPFVTEFQIAVIGATAGDGVFTIDDYANFVLNTSGGTLDLTRELLGQPTPGDPFGTAGTFDPQATGAPAPTGFGGFQLGTFGGSGAGNTLVMTSFRPILEELGASANIGATALAGDVALTDVQVFVSIGRQPASVDPQGIASVSIADPANLTRILLPLAEAPIALALAGDHLYALEDFGLRVIAQANFTELLRISTPGTAGDLAAQGDFLFAGIGESLRVYDVSDPGSPTQVAVLGTAATSSVEVQGTRLFLGEGPGGLRIVDVTDPADPRQLSLLGGLPAEALAPFGSLVLVGNDSGLTVVDASNPALPVVVASLFVPLSGAVGLAVDGEMAFLSDAAGVRAIDISDPGAPNLLSTYMSTDDVLGIAAGAGRVYAGAGLGGLRVLLATEPFAPVVPLERGTLAATAAASRTIGELAYVADSVQGLRVADVWNSAAPGALGSVSVGAATDLRVVGSRAYVTHGSTGLSVVDVSDASAPALLGSLDTPDHAGALRVVGHRVYVADGLSGVRIIDAGDPGTLVEEAFFDTAGNARALDVSGVAIYVADGTSGVQFLISLPMTPIFPLGSFPTCDAAGIEVVPGNRAYVADSGCGLRVLDTSNLGSPQLGILDTPGNALDVAVAGDRVFVADCLAGVRVIDVTDPAAPVEVGSIDTPGCAQSVEWVGGRLYISDDTGGLRIAALPQLSGCGNGVVDAGEQCDDAGGTLEGDGCDELCQFEGGFSCTGTPSACTTTCGDSITAGAERCDDGGNADGDCCSSVCGFETPGSSCNMDMCTVDSVCDGAGSCSGGGAQICDDALFCNGAESCDPGAGCLSGVPPSADDAVSCTLDSCNEFGDIILNIPDDSLCSNGLFCDGAEVCDASLDCVSSAPPISDDGVGCTLDSCDETNDVALNVPMDGLCDDGALCNGSEVCDAALDCQSGIGIPPTALEDFETYLPQADLAGIFVESVGTFYRVSEGSDSVATAVAASVGSTGIAIDGSGNGYWTIDAMSSGPFVAEGDIPPDPEALLTETGPLAAYFASPRNLGGPQSFVCADVREIAGSRPSTARILLGDADGNFAAGPEMALASNFHTLELEPAIDVLEQLGGTPVDLARIDTIGLEFATATGSDVFFAFDVDDVRVAIPEPAGMVSMLAALVALNSLAAGRRARRSQRRRV